MGFGLFGDDGDDGDCDDCCDCDEQLDDGNLFVVLFGGVGDFEALV